MVVIFVTPANIKNDSDVSTFLPPDFPLCDYLTIILVITYYFCMALYLIIQPLNEYVE